MRLSWERRRLDYTIITKKSTHAAMYRNRKAYHMQGKAPEHTFTKANLPIIREDLDLGLLPRCVFHAQFWSYCSTTRFLLIFTWFLKLHQLLNISSLFCSGEAMVGPVALAVARALRPVEPSSWFLFIAGWVDLSLMDICSRLLARTVAGALVLAFVLHPDSWTFQDVYICP